MGCDNDRWFIWENLSTWAIWLSNYRVTWSCSLSRDKGMVQCFYKSANRWPQTGTPWSDSVDNSSEDISLLYRRCICCIESKRTKWRNGVVGQTFLRLCRCLPVDVEKSNAGWVLTVVTFTFLNFHFGAAFLHYTLLINVCVGRGRFLVNGWNLRSFGIA